ncbi:hypothetical protein ONS95_006245 [Cadophora gregata]|uniref:uncharacterized protein n=1 Tax=Cadophora gregata TaxID=51156 RepID=UPI0026DBDF33|nr:uncharacterized protein ONS95_006245 [Cadophora gregata]KAK0102641.1 hypothetical protein ONS95_006245 [Cadophora gregata]KAK0104294.1 hypothetical protein ONS96_005383 [Cadophora gregata f. sp. sojae]
MVIYATDMSPTPSPSPSPSPPSFFSSKSQSKQPHHHPTPFPFFPLLPLELRLQIYSESLLQHPRVLSITSTPTSSLHCPSPHSALLSLNREARREALQSYHLIRDLEGESGFYYNPHLDTIHLTSSTKYSSSSSADIADGAEEGGEGWREEGEERDGEEVAASSTSTPQTNWLLHLSQITSSLPSPLGVYSLALRGVSTLPPSSAFLFSGGSKVREMLMLVGPGAHRSGASTYCGVSVGFMRRMMCREMERALELMDQAGGFESGRCPGLVPLVGGGEGDVEGRVLEVWGGGVLVVR